ncbi:hypothetical protein H4R18_003594 [Coemansia javaensis]|uniref:Uncharacterized protein n=1 Tax=Coemansia javaensis TaxID=2761396 RepID=A0A9W8H898_9FUNG|nr:hypothetical protein H4R18_003594 [Coemansia javaensis]
MEKAGTVLAGLAKGYRILYSPPKPGQPLGEMVLVAVSKRHDVGTTLAQRGYKEVESRVIKDAIQAASRPRL